MNRSNRHHIPRAGARPLSGIARLAALFAAAALLGGCAAEQTPVPHATTTAARVYEAHCSACHSLPSPKRLYYSQWVHMVGVMEGNMTHQGMKPLSAEDRKIILEYLKANAR